MKSLKIIAGVLVLLVGVYAMGPAPTAPNLSKSYTFDLPNNLKELEEFIVNHEISTEGLKDGNQAQFMWNDSIPVKTEYSIVYLHGFSASEEEGDPVHRNIAKKYNANLYLARLAEHGLDLGDQTMASLTADKYIASAEMALEIGRKIGNKVILIGTSAGGALTVYLASKYDDIEAIVLYSPCIEIKDANAKLLDNPWGLNMAKAIQGKDFNDITPKNSTQPLYWSMHYRLEALVALQNFLTEAMTPAVFGKISIPTLLAYYYENEENQDMVVSIDAMLEMYESLSTPEKYKRKVALPTTRDHVIASYVMSEDYMATQEATIQFLDEIVFNQ